MAHGGRELLGDVELSVVPGEFVALVGPNGAGKTTLLKTAAGLVRPTRGLVTLDGRALAALSPKARAAAVAWLPQQALVEELLCADDVVSTARYRFDESHAHTRRKAREALRAVGAEHLAERWVPTLSGGENQRIALATLLAQEAPLLLVDEPANHLDPAQQIRIYELLGELWCRGLGILCVTHDINLLRFLAGARAPRVIGLDRGSIRFDLGYDAPELATELGRLFGVEVQPVGSADRRVFLAHPLGRSGAREPVTP
ncbi:MAG: ABC transporter ATP-binding protein [Polyangiaceae bacterium]|nr:ABC transporter ATP-binding protein [Polyangiaceae bacterium]